MKLLLDTHVIIWALTDDSRLTDEARTMIASDENIIYYSAASIWEIAVKNQKAPQKCPYHEKDITEYCNRAGYLPIPIQLEHILGIRELAVREDRYLSNYDPFDRIILSQAKLENCILLSHDSLFHNYDEKCICII